MAAANCFAPSTDDPIEAEDLYLPAKRVQRDRRSKLMKSYAKAGGRMAGAHLVNPCKQLFGDDGCERNQLDSEGYCKHLVGFTVQGDDRHYHPMVPRVTEKGIFVDLRFVDGKQKLEVQPGDELVRITTCCRVYRRNPEEPKVEVKKAKAKPNAED